MLRSLLLVADAVRDNNPTTESMRLKWLDLVCSRPNQGRQTDKEMEAAPKELNF